MELSEGFLAMDDDFSFLGWPAPSRSFTHNPNLKGITCEPYRQIAAAPLSQEGKDTGRFKPRPARIEAEQNKHRTARALATGSPSPASAPRLSRLRHALTRHAFANATAIVSRHPAPNSDRLRQTSAGHTTSPKAHAHKPPAPHPYNLPA